MLITLYKGRRRGYETSKSYETIASVPISFQSQPKESKKNVNFCYNLQLLLQSWKEKMNGDCLHPIVVADCQPTDRTTPYYYLVHIQRSKHFAITAPPGVY